MNITHSQKGAHIRLMGLRGERVSQKDYKIDLIIGDESANLEVATQRTRLE